MQMQLTDANVKEILQDVYLEPHLEELRPQIRYASKLGFLAMQGQGENVHILGFHASTAATDTMPVATRLEDRPEELRTLPENAKGVGVMLGSTRRAIERPRRKGGVTRFGGLWMTGELSPNDIKNFSHKTPDAWLWLALGVARHAYRALDDKLNGTAEAIRRIERPYGESPLVVMDPAPTWALPQRMGYPGRPAVAGRWALYRPRHGELLHRVGSYESSDGRR